MDYLKFTFTWGVFINGLGLDISSCNALHVFIHSWFVSCSFELHALLHTLYSREIYS